MLLRFALPLFMTIIHFSSLTQEKYLQVSIYVKDEQQKEIKDYRVAVTTSDGIEFVMNKRKKNKKFYLPAGEKYFISIEKNEFHTRFVEIDLREIPAVFQNNKKESLSLIVLLLPSHLDAPIPVEKYTFSQRYTKVVKL